MNVAALRKGDCLLYRPASIFGWVIAVKTYHPISHVEVFESHDWTCPRSWASRDGIGVSLYPLRTAQLSKVLRPTASLNYDAADDWALSMIGTPYGWWDLLNFVGIPIETGGIFCSEFSTEYYRQAGWNLFPEDPARTVAPYENQLLVGAGFADVTKEIIS